MSGASLSFSGVRFSYGERTVLQELSLEIRPGERVALLGANGAGKSTLLALAAGVRAPQAGSVRLDGEDLPRMSANLRARRLAMVPQDPVVPFAFTVREWVSLGRTPYLSPLGGERQGDRNAVERAMEQAGVAELAGRLMGELSGGERQRTALAQALAQEPRLLLLDEATAHLDLRHQMALLEAVSRQSGEMGLTVVAAIHDVNLAALWFQRLVLLSGGRVLAEGAPAQVLQPDLLRAAFGCDVDVVAHPSAPVPLVALRPPRPG